VIDMFHVYCKSRAPLLSSFKGVHTSEEKDGERWIVREERSTVGKLQIVLEWRQTEMFKVQ